MMIGSTLIRLLAPGLVSGITDVIKGFQQGKVTEAEMAAKVHTAVTDAVAGVSESQAQVIVAELRGENWLQRNWRPMVAVAFAFVMVFYGLLMPIAVAWFGAPPVRVGDALLGWIMQAVMVCLGGYICGRSLEKVVRLWRR